MCLELPHYFDCQNLKEQMLKHLYFEAYAEGACASVPLSMERNKKTSEVQTKRINL